MVWDCELHSKVWSSSSDSSTFREGDVTLYAVLPWCVVGAPWFAQYSTFLFPFKITVDCGSYDIFVVLIFLFFSFSFRCPLILFRLYGISLSLRTVSCSAEDFLVSTCVVAGAEDHFQDLPAHRNTTSIIKELLPQSQSNKLIILQVTRGRDPPRTWQISDPWGSPPATFRLASNNCRSAGTYVCTDCLLG